MALNPAQKKFLRGLGHGLKPVLIVGDHGLTDTLLREFERALAHHELIKVSVRGRDRRARDAIINALCDHGAAELVQRIGNVALIFRRNPDTPKIEISSASE